jgi:hypothetical protein
MEQPYIAVEVRPEGVLLRPEADDLDGTGALVDLVPEDAPPPPSRLRRLWRRLRHKQKKAAA